LLRAEGEPERAAGGVGQRHGLHFTGGRALRVGGFDFGEPAKRIGDERGIDRGLRLVRAGQGPLEREPPLLLGAGVGDLRDGHVPHADVGQGFQGGRDRGRGGVVADGRGGLTTKGQRERAAGQADGRVKTNALHFVDRTPFSRSGSRGGRGRRAAVDPFLVRQAIKVVVRVPRAPANSVGLTHQVAGLIGLIPVSVFVHRKELSRRFASIVRNIFPTNNLV